MRGKKRKPIGETGTMLDGIMRERNLSSYALAELSGVARTHIGMILRGEREPRPETLRRLLKPLGLELTTRRDIVPLSK